MKIYLWMFYLLLFAAVCSAQEPSSPPSENSQQEVGIQVDGQSQPATDESVPSTKTANEDIPSRGSQSFADDVFRSSKNHWGFSLNAYEAYSTDTVPQAQGFGDATITSLASNIFFNLGKRKSKFHLGFGSGYRLYQHHKDLNGWDYSGNAQYSLQFSKKTSFQISNMFSSSANDLASSLSIYPSIRNDYPSASSEVLFNDRQRIVRDSMSAGFSFQLSRRARLGLSTGYDLYGYSQTSLTDTNAVRATVDFGYKLAKWLSFSSSYSDYLNKVDDFHQGAQIHRLQIGGFDFNLTRFWRIWTSGGIDFSDYQGNKNLQENVNAGIGYSSRNISLRTTYQRGLTSASGLSRLMQSDSINASFGYRISRRVSTSLQSYYSRSRDSLSTGTLKTIAGNAGLEFALRNDLSLSLNSSYQNQQQHNFSYGYLQVNRFSAYISLQYVWPSRRRSDY
jgi:hypothetical protein